MGTFFSLLAFFTLLLTKSDSQPLTTTNLFNCSCSPLVYRLRLDFTSPCPPYNVTTGPNSGIQRVFCQISSTNRSVNSTSPIIVTDYRIIELSQLLSPIRIKSVTNVALQSGSYISFESSTLLNSSIITGGIQVSMTGVSNTVSDNILTLNVILQYTNRCGVLPFNFGSSLGWIAFEGDLRPLTGTCLLLTNPPTHSPTIIFSPPTTIAPSSVPFISPTSSPSLSPPTSSPSLLTTSYPSLSAPTSSSPSLSPISSPSSSPTLSSSPSLCSPSSPTTVAPTFIKKRSSTKFKKKKTKSKGKAPPKKKKHSFLHHHSKNPSYDYLSMKWNIFDHDETEMLLSKSE